MAQYGAGIVPDRVDHRPDVQYNSGVEGIESAQDSSDKTVLQSGRPGGYAG
jgi:hypothetical protein